MKRYFSFFVIVALIVSVVVSSCEKDDGLPVSPVSTLDVKVEDGNDYDNIINEVRLICYNSNNGNPVTLAIVKYSEGGFKMNLPESIPSSVMENIVDIFEADSKIDISKKNSKIAIEIELVAFNKNNEKIGYFFYCKEETDNTYVETLLFYSDSEVNLTGKETYENGTEVWNVSLKMGWNQVFLIEKDLSEDKWEDTFTTKNQSGLKWYFEYD